MNPVLKWTFIVFFATHIPITLCVDLQALFGSHFPQLLRDLLAWYVSEFNDELMGNPPVWFQSIVLLELIVQIPFFFVAIYALWTKKSWIRIPSIAYGIHVATTVWPIMATVISSGNSSINQKIILLGFYFPYFAIPLFFALYMMVHDKPFKNSAKKA